MPVEKGMAPPDPTPESNANRPPPPAREPAGKAWLVTGLIAVASIIFCIALVWLTIAREGLKW